MLRAALNYHRIGWSIIPVHGIVKDRCTCGNKGCPSPGKHPRVSWLEYTEKRATKRQVEQWFSDDFWGSNIGLVTGTISQTMVVDIDLPGKSLVRAVREALELPKHTLIARTGGGGYHLFYKMVKSVPSRIGLLAGVDIKAERGFVVLPPSAHHSGNRYKWLEKAPLAPYSMPDFISYEIDRENGIGWYTPLLKGVQEGERNGVLVKLAGRYCNMGLSFPEVAMLLESWNQLNSPPLERSSLQATIKSVYRKHQTRPVNTELTDINSLAKELLKIGERK